jgi:N6-L-threonylcarbamoyladenine synthase
MACLCKRHDWQLFMPEIALCGDNAAMVGAQGYYERKAGNVAQMDLNACATMPIEA